MNASHVECALWDITLPQLLGVPSVWAIHSESEVVFFLLLFFPSEETVDSAYRLVMAEGVRAGIVATCQEPSSGDSSRGGHTLTQRPSNWSRLPS